MGVARFADPEELEEFLARVQFASEPRDHRVDFHCIHAGTLRAQCCSHVVATTTADSTGAYSVLFDTAKLTACNLGAPATGRPAPTAAT